MQPLNSNLPNNSNTNKILQNINGLFSIKNQNYNNSNNPNPFNIGNNKIPNILYNFNSNKYNIQNMNNFPKEYRILNNNQNPININQNSQINENNINLYNELMAQKMTLENIGMGQSPIFENEQKSDLFGQNSNEDYKLYQQLVENNKSSLDKIILQNYKNNENNNNTNNKEIKKNIINNNNPLFNINNNNNLNITSPSDKNNINVINIKLNKDNNIPISKFNPINNNNKEKEKKSISDEIRNRLEKININEISPDWFQNENNFQDPLYFEKLKKFELQRMGIKPLQLSDFLIGRKLGSGQFGTVYLAKLKSTQFICALKIINKKRLLKEPLKCINQVRREIEIQSHLRHKNILSIYNFFWDNKNIYLVMEYAPGGELFTILRNEENGRFSEPRAAFYTKQVCDALEYIHKLHIIHRDIKPENILLSNEVIKLADFGWSIHQNSNNLRTTFCGTAEYMPPEVIDDQPHIPSSDLWCIGILIFELCSGEPPFTAKTNPEILKRIKAFKMKKFPDYFSNDVKDLIGKIMRRFPKDRITIQEIKNHPWIVKNCKKYCS